MRLVSLFIAITASLTLGCSHAAKKSDAKPAASPAQGSGHSPASDGSQIETHKETPTSSTKVECSVKGDERILEIREKGAGCELFYTKGGNEGSVASANKGQEHCQKILEKMREKLTGSGYTCK